MNGYLATIQGMQHGYQISQQMKEDKRQKAYQGKLNALLGGGSGNPIGSPVGTPGIVPNAQQGPAAPTPIQQLQGQPQPQPQQGLSPQVQALQSGPNYNAVAQLAAQHGDSQGAHRYSQIAALQGQQSQAAQKQQGAQQKQEQETLYRIGKGVLDGQYTLDQAKQFLVQNGADPQELAQITDQTLPQQVAMLEARLGGQQVLKDKEAVYNSLTGQIVASNRGPQTVSDGTDLVGADGTVLHSNQKDTDPVKPTADIQNYQFAKENGFQGTFSDYQTQIKQAGRSQNNVTVNGEKGPQVGSIPKGFQLEKTPDGSYRMSPIPGGPVDLANKRRADRQSTAGGTVIQDIGRALEMIEGTDLASGPIAGQTRRVPGTPADVVNKLVNSAASNIGIDQLQAMRESSPTGGALGQIPFQQQKRLEQMLGSLDVTQPDDVLVDNLKRIQNLYNDIVHGEGNGPERHNLSFDGQGRSIANNPSQPASDGWNDLGDGVRFRVKR